LNNFQEVASGVGQMLEPANLAEFRKNVATQNNRAIFEIPEILAKLLDEASSAAPAGPTPIPASTTNSV
jgi:hypothetical protein